MHQLADWLAQPYKGERGSAWSWFLFVGLIVIALILWGQIINDVRGAL